MLKLLAFQMDLKQIIAWNSMLRGQDRSIDYTGFQNTILTTWI